MKLRNERGAALVTVLAIAFILNVVLIALFFSVSSTMKKSGSHRVKATTLNIAEAGKEDLYSLIRSGAFTPKSNQSHQPLTSRSFAKGSYTVQCSSNTDIDTIWVRSRGDQGGLHKTVETMASMFAGINISMPPVKGAVTARSSIVVKGNICIDGRDYDSTGTLVGNGLFGVSTCGTLSQDGSSDIGGNGVAPMSDKNLGGLRSTVMNEFAAIESSMASPEKFLGLPDGSLDAYKSTTLNAPFRALKYITSDYVGPVHFDSSFGILIVHNATKTAELQINNGVFKGIIITDKMAKISGNAQIYGAVITLSDGEVSTFGTGTADIRYSAQILKNLARYCSNLPKKVQEISWREIN